MGEPNLRRAVAARLKAARVRAGLTQREVAALMGLDTQTVWRQESALLAVSLEQLDKLARIYSTSLVELVAPLKVPEPEPEPVRSRVRKGCAA